MHATQSTSGGSTTTTYSGISGIQARFIVDSESEASAYGRNAELATFTICVDPSVVVSKMDKIYYSGLSSNVNPYNVDVVQVNDNHRMGVYTTVKGIEVR